MIWNMEEYMRLRCFKRDGICSLDYLKNKVNQKEYDCVIKSIQSFKPEVNEKDVILVVCTDYVKNAPVYDILFTKDSLYVNNHKAYPLYGIQNLTVSKRTVGLFSKKTISDVSLIYKDETEKFSIDGISTWTAMKVFEEFYKFGSDGIVKPSFKQQREEAVSFLSNNMEFMFENILDDLSKEDNDSIIMLMDYYYNKKDYASYEKYKQLAKDKHIPQAYYHEGYINYINGNHLEANKNYLRAYNYGIGDSIVPELKNMRNILKGASKKDRKPYRYNVLDIDPYMFDCISSSDYYDSYLEFLNKNQVNTELVDKWKLDNYSKVDFKISKKNDTFYNAVYDFMKVHFGLSVRYYDMSDFKDAVEEELRGSVYSNDKGMFQLVNTFDHIEINSLPNPRYNDFRLSKLKIDSFLDERPFVGERQYSIYNDERAYNLIKDLNDYPDFKKNRLNDSKKESIAYLESKISEYEDIMTFFKQGAVRLMALYYIWATPGTDASILAFDRDKYIEEAKERILRIDEKFLDVKNAYLKQMNISDRDLFKTPTQNKDYSNKEIQNKGLLILSTPNCIKNYVNLYVYDNNRSVENALKNINKKYCCEIKKEDILFYAGFSSSSFHDEVILTRDLLYADKLNKPISLKNLIALKTTPYETVVALYDDGREEVFEYSYSWANDISRLVNLVNELLIYLW